MELKDVDLKELEKRYKRERDGKIKERLHYLLLLKEGYRDRDIEKICHTSKSKVSFWHCRFKAEGFEGLRDKKGRGKKPKLSEADLKELDSILENPYQMENGYTRGWQTKDVHALIKSKFGFCSFDSKTKTQTQKSGRRGRVQRAFQKKTRKPGRRHDDNLLGRGSFYN